MTNPRMPELSSELDSTEAASGEIRGRVATMLRESNVKIAVVDDDPTGTQTVRDVPLVTGWGEAELEWAMRRADPLFAVVTNSRSLPERSAVAANREIAERLVGLAARFGVRLRVISRSDSTLRGHFPAEPEALAVGLGAEGEPIDAILLCPAYPEAGRVTIDDVHLLRDGERLLPVAESEFAADASFGYHSSDLREWVRERIGADATVGSLALDALRTGGAELIADRLLELRGTTRYVIGNAVTGKDLDVLALGVALAEERGMRILYRTGPSFLAARAGIAPAAPLALGQIASPGARGLIVVGSHTELTSAQLRAARNRHALRIVDVDVDRLVGADEIEREAAIDDLANRAQAALMMDDVALVTGRRRIVGADRADSLAIAATIGSALVDVVGRVARATQLGWMIAKGGITSYDVAARALRARRATVIGQVFSGQISVWQLHDGVVGGLRYVVFPGNVGERASLAETLDRLKGLA
jgi:uncharacterized protein YgbK (DUF1537 family)